MTKLNATFVSFGILNLSPGSIVVASLLTLLEQSTSPIQSSQIELSLKYANNQSNLPIQLDESKILVIRINQSIIILFIIIFKCKS